MGKYILRRLLRSPGFTAITLITLVIGIGANTALFSVINGVLLKPLPYRNPDGLVGLWHTAPGMNLKELEMAPSNYFMYREDGRAFQDLGLYRNGTVSITQIGQPEEVRTLLVTDGTLPVLGIQPLLGHLPTRRDDTEGNPLTAVLTYGYWQSRFGGSPSAVGRHIVADGRDCEVIGVLPQNFHFMNPQPQLILPIQFNRNKIVLGNYVYKGVARLKPDVTIAQANADVARMLPFLTSRFPPPAGYSRTLFDDARFAPAVRPFKQDLVGDVGEVLWILMSTMAAVFLIACANVANLVLVRAEGRQQELAIRMALGASRRQVALDLIAESVALGLTGGVLGLCVASVTVRLLVSIAPSTLPRLDEISIDPVVLAFTFALSLLAGVLFGALPVFRYARVQMGTGLRESGRTVGHSRARHRARRFLVIAQVALALVLLISSGLLIRTFQALRNVQPGFSQPEELLTFRVSIPEALVRDPERVVRMQGDIRERLAAIAGVSAVAYARGIPMDGNDNKGVVFVEDHAIPEGKIPPVRRFKFVSPGFSGTMGNAILAGRDINWTDAYSFRPVVIVSENFAREYWHDPRQAVGRRVRESNKAEWREVIGVVGDEYDDGVNSKAPPILYWPPANKNFWGADMAIWRTMTFVLRSRRTGSSALLDEVRRAVWSVTPNSPIANVQTMKQIYDKSMTRTSFTLVMLTISAGMALLLSLIGIYGVVSYSVSQRKREIGVRMALGARESEVCRMFVSDGAMLAVIGVVIGLAAATALTHLMKSVLFGVDAMDVYIYTLVSIGLAAAAVLASYFPARRAASLSPIEMLRAE